MVVAFLCGARDRFNIVTPFGDTPHAEYRATVRAAEPPDLDEVSGLDTVLRVFPQLCITNYFV